MSPADFDAWLRDRRRRPLVMGVLNVTPDSFSDGDRYADPAAAVARGRQLIADGADLLDVGGESTRPGATRTPPDEQVRRVRPVIEALAAEFADRCVLSIDTTRAAVARAALDAGATMINDISAGVDDPAILTLAAERKCPIALMHMQGQPATMQDAPAYRHVVNEVRAHLAARCQAAVDAGVDRERIVLDPGIGFGKTAAHNLELLRNLTEFAALGRPLLLGTSRKGFIGRIAGEPDPSDRRFGTAATVAWCVANRARIVRVHDVAEMAKVVRVTHAIMTGAVE